MDSENSRVLQQDELRKEIQDNDATKRRTVALCACGRC